MQTEPGIANCYSVRYACDRKQINYAHFNYCLHLVCFIDIWKRNVVLLCMMSDRSRMICQVEIYICDSNYPVSPIYLWV